MAKLKLVKTNEKIAEEVVGSYKNIEKTVVGAFNKISDKFDISQKDLKTLFSMTPYFYRTSEADKAKLDNVENIELTASFIILEYVKEG